MKTFKDLSIGDPIWMVDIHGCIDEDHYSVRYVDYNVIGKEEKNNMIYLRVFNNTYGLGFLIYLPLIEQNMYWTECNERTWFTDLNAFQKRTYDLIKSALSRFDGYIYSDNLALEECQETIKLEFEGQDKCKSYDEYFTYLLENAPEKVPNTYFLTRNSLQFHCDVFERISKLLDNQELIGMNQVNDILWSIEKDKQKFLDSYPCNPINQKLC